MHAQPISPALEQAEQPNAPLRVRDIAAALRVDTSTVYAEIRSGRLESYRVGTGRGTIRVTRTAFTTYLSERGIPAAVLAVAL